MKWGIFPHRGELPHAGLLILWPSQRIASSGSGCTVARGMLRKVLFPARCRFTIY